MRRHTWREHPTEEAAINHPTGRDAGSPIGGIGSISGAPSGAQPCQGGWGRQGMGKGYDINMWSEQGGCTLSLRAMRARRPSIFNPVSNRTRSDNKIRNQINHRRIRATVDGIGGEFYNDLQTRVFNGCQSGMGRQAQGLPQNLEPWCPGSLLTNMANLFAMPTSAKPFRRDWVYPCGLGQPLVRSWKPLFPKETRT